MKKKSSNNVRVEITPVGVGSTPYVVSGKGRNSVSQRIFGVRAYQALLQGKAKSITTLTDHAKRR